MFKSKQSSAALLRFIERVLFVTSQSDSIIRRFDLCEQLRSSPYLANYRYLIHTTSCLSVWIQFSANMSRKVPEAIKPRTKIPGLPSWVHDGVLLVPARLTAAEKFARRCQTSYYVNLAKEMKVAEEQQAKRDQEALKAAKALAAKERREKAHEERERLRREQRARELLERVRRERAHSAKERIERVRIAEKRRENEQRERERIEREKREKEERTRLWSEHREKERRENDQKERMRRERERIQYLCRERENLNLNIRKEINKRYDDSVRKPTEKKIEALLETNMLKRALAPPPPRILKPMKRTVLDRPSVSSSPSTLPPINGRLPAANLLSPVPPTQGVRPDQPKTVVRRRLLVDPRTGSRIDLDRPSVSISPLPPPPINDCLTAVLRPFPPKKVYGIWADQHRAENKRQSLVDANLAQMKAAEQQQAKTLKAKKALADKERRERERKAEELRERREREHREKLRKVEARREEACREKARREEARREEKARREEERREEERRKEAERKEKEHREEERKQEAERREKEHREEEWRLRRMKVFLEVPREMLAEQEAAREATTLLKNKFKELMGEMALAQSRVSQQEAERSRLCDQIGKLEMETAEKRELSVPYSQMTAFVQELFKRTMRGVKFDVLDPLRQLEVIQDFFTFVRNDQGHHHYSHPLSESRKKTKQGTPTKKEATLTTKEATHTKREARHKAPAVKEELELELELLLERQPEAHRSVQGSEEMIPWAFRNLVEDHQQALDHKKNEREKIKEAVDQCQQDINSLKLREVMNRIDLERMREEINFLQECRGDLDCLRRKFKQLSEKLTEFHEEIVGKFHCPLDPLKMLLELEERVDRIMGDLTPEKHRKIRKDLLKCYDDSLKQRKEEKIEALRAVWRKNMMERTLAPPPPSITEKRPVPRMLPPLKVKKEPVKQEPEPTNDIDWFLQ